MGLHLSESLNGSFGASGFGEPAWRAREKGNANHKAHGGNKLDTLCSAKEGGALHEGAAVSDKEHYQDAPLNGQLLDHDDRTAFFRPSDLRKADGYLGGSNANANAIDDTNSDEHTVVVTSDLDSSSDKPKYAGDEYGIATTISV